MNKYLEKIASNAVGRRLNHPGVGLSVSGGAMNSGVNKATFAVGKKQLAAGVTGNARSMAMQRAGASQAGHLPSSAAAKSFGDTGTDRLATTNIHQRLAEHRSTLGLSAANGNRTHQIANSHALRNGASKLQGVSGVGQTAAMAANGRVANSAMNDAKQGHQAVLNVNHNGGASYVSGNPASIPKPSMLDRVMSKAKGLGSQVLTKAKSVAAHMPLKKIGIGAAAIGAGMAVHHAAANRDSNQMSYSQY